MLDPVVPSPATLARRPARDLTPADHAPDLILIERARAADDAAIEALVRRYGRRLFRVARSVIADDDRAEQIVQEAYLAAFSDLTRYEPTGKFAAWLTRLAYQSARLQRGVRFTATAAPAAAAAGDTEARERLELEQAIGALPEVFRTVFVLRVLEGVSGIETAASLGVHETTVRTRLYRAHRRLDPELLRRARGVLELLELPGARLERLVARVRAQLPRNGLLAIPTRAP